MQQDFSMELFRREEQRREQIYKQVQNCTTITELLEILKKNPSIPGQNIIVSGAEMAQVFQGVEGSIEINGSPVQREAKRKIIKMALLQLTRSCGIRKKAAGLLKCDHLFEKKFFEEPVGTDSEGDHTT